ncbi:hypothetical protein BD413DRAFT_313246 [Trametes elegans]|nr:hypothetical protein BD413DRAFT_313246 [Trametes elegans]
MFRTEVLLQALLVMCAVEVDIGSVPATAPTSTDFSLRHKHVSSHGPNRTSLVQMRPGIRVCLAARLFTQHRAQSSSNNKADNNNQGRRRTQSEARGGGGESRRTAREGGP